MKTFICTLDYELFGNGSGDIIEDIVKPTERLLAIARKHNLKFTIFFEAIEFLKIREYNRVNVGRGLYKETLEIVEKQIIDAYLAGHDIQLHIHPQWWDAVLSDGKWKVGENWSLGDFGSEEKIYSVIKAGKNYLEELIHRVDTNYRCIAIRAGGYMAQPGKSMCSAMKKLGLVIDSSVVPGDVLMSSRGGYDYSQISPESDYLYFDKLSGCESSEIIELPITTFPLRRIRKLCSISAIKARLSNKKSSLDSFAALGNNSLIKKIRYIFASQWQTFDFCILMPDIQRNFLKEALRSHKKLFVVIGHPKSFHEDKNFSFFMNYMAGKDVDFCTISEFYHRNFKA